MASLRLALAAPRFWPLVGDGPNHWLALAEALTSAGHAVTVVTPQWERAWPRQMAIGKVALVRLRGAPRGGWSTLRWMYSLANWVNGQQLDGVLAAGQRHEAYVALGASEKTRIPAILLAGEGDLAWQRTAAFGGRIAARCAAARAIVAPSQALADELILGGCSAQAISVIPRRVVVPPPRSAAARAAARAALAAVNYDLATTTTAPVALAVGRLDAEQRFGDLVRAWRIVSARRSEARLWIIGDGPDRERLFRQISDLDQKFRVLIPGTFDCLEQLIEAADLLAVPAEFRVPPLAMLQSLAAGLPVVAGDSPAVREAVAHERTGLLHPVGDFKVIATQVLELFEQPAKGIALGSAARGEAQLLPTPADEAAEYVALFQRLRR